MTENIIGLTSAEIREKIKEYGPNEIIEKKDGLAIKIIKSAISPISVMLLLAAALSYYGGKIFDAYFIIFLLLINLIVSLWQERKADNAIAELNKYLAVSVSVLRDGQWRKVDSKELVPGDIVEIFMGDVVAADLEAIEVNNFSLNEAALTGESLPVEKKQGDKMFSGSFVATGTAKARVKATGKSTYFGKTLSAVDTTKKRSQLEKDIMSIAKFLIYSSLVAVVILTLYFLIKKLPFMEIVSLDLSLIIAGIPIALPTVMTLIISLGIITLSKKNVVIRRLASLDDLANVDILFTDKTGTLTKNEINIAKVIDYDGEDALFYAYLASAKNGHDLINMSIAKKAEAVGITKRDFEIKSFIPADSIRKRVTAIAKYGNEDICVSLGAPQIIAELCSMPSGLKILFEGDIAHAAEDGYRVLAVAVGKEEKDMSLKGIIYLSDELRSDAKNTIDLLKEDRIEVRMLTGDNHAIGQRIGRELGLEPRNVFSEILPSDKHDLVAKAKGSHIVAVTGDGINDLLAVKTADVGFAVSNAVSALKGTADIVLLTSGISVIHNAIIEARRIFARLYSYSVYRIAESFRVIVTILILGFIFHSFPLSPIQLILLALMNDIPIVSLAFNRVGIAKKPAKLNAKRRLSLSVMFGLGGVMNSMILLWILLSFFHYDWNIISTVFFLKLTVSGHLLVFVAHTKERWYKFLPSWQVTAAIIGTQFVSTVLAIGGFFMTGISWQLALLVWLWGIIWMQVDDRLKDLQKFFEKTLPIKKQPA